MSFWEPPFSPSHTLSVPETVFSRQLSCHVCRALYVSQWQAQSLLYSYHFLTS